MSFIFVHVRIIVAFKLLDTDCDGKLSKEELMVALRAMVRIGVTEEQASLAL